MVLDAGRIVSYYAPSQPTDRSRNVAGRVRKAERAAQERKGHAARIGGRERRQGEALHHGQRRERVCVNAGRHFLETRFPLWDFLFIYTYCHLQSTVLRSADLIASQTCNTSRYNLCVLYWIARDPGSDTYYPGNPAMSTKEESPLARRQGSIYPTSCHASASWWKLSCTFSHGGIKGAVSMNAFHPCSRPRSLEHSHERRYSPPLIILYSNRLRPDLEDPSLPDSHHETYLCDSE